MEINATDGTTGVDDNATFSEVDGICVNEIDGCEE